MGKGVSQRLQTACASRQTDQIFLCPCEASSGPWLFIEQIVKIELMGRSVRVLTGPHSWRPIFFSWWSSDISETCVAWWYGAQYLDNIFFTFIGVVFLNACLLTESLREYSYRFKAESPSWMLVGLIWLENRYIDICYLPSADAWTSLFSKETDVLHMFLIIDCSCHLTVCRTQFLNY